MGAAETGDTNCVRLLLDAGADTEAKNDVRMIGSESLGVMMNHVSRLFASLSPEILFMMIHATTHVLRLMRLFYVSFAQVPAQDGKTALNRAKENGKHKIVRMIEVGFLIALISCSTLNTFVLLPHGSVS